ncbi:Panacea domain-containing protein [Shewanella indica]|uniref:Panacea domain-containing protein n=1 Tax=Shewanella indica TaxID=768528 RepID=UPI003006D271
MSCETVAIHLLRKAEERGVEDITQMKLHKLLYYVQGYHLALHGERAFPDRIKAYNHGPVASALYGVLRRRTTFMQVLSAAFLSTIYPQAAQATLPAKTEQIIDSVMDEFAHYSALELRAMTHRESPWLAHCTSRTAETADGSEITVDELQDYFDVRLTEAYTEDVVRSALSLNEQDYIRVPEHVKDEDAFVRWMMS